MATEVIEKIINCIDENRHFILEAGAGSGKTHTLMQTINYLQNGNRKKNLGKKQNILCITYTNVAKNEIIERLDCYKGITIATMHEFLWDFIKQFQLELEQQVKKLIEIDIDKHNSIIEKANKIVSKPKSNTNIEKKMEEIENSMKKLERYKTVKINSIDYKSYVALHKGYISHDEIIKIATEFLKSSFFSKLFLDSYTHIFIDEYQDSNENIMLQLLESIKDNKNNEYLVLGLFGDKMQQIYSKGLNNFDYEKFSIESIEKLDNYRTCKEIIDANNAFRGDKLKQEHKNPEYSLDKIEFIYNLNTDVYLRNYPEIEIDKYKRLFLSHKEIANEIGFSSISDIFENEYGRYSNDKLLKLEDGFIKYVLENVMVLINDLKNGKSDTIINKFIKEIFVQSDLLDLKEKLTNCLNKNVTLKDLIDNLIELKLLHLKDYEGICENYFLNDKTDFINSLLQIEIKEYLLLYKQINKETNLQTLHGVKGDEFEKVIVNIREGQGWSSYNFDKLFLIGNDNTPALENAHKLFYVACTRAKNSLIINYMATSKDIERKNMVMLNVQKSFGGIIKTKEY